MKRPLRNGLQVLRWLGPRWACQRFVLAVRKKTGSLKRGLTTAPLKALKLVDLVRPGVESDPVGVRANRQFRSGQFFFKPGRLPDRDLLIRVAGPDAVRRTVEIADNYCKGRFLYFSRHLFDLGRPPHWLFNPFTNAEHRADIHWCDYPTFSTSLGDVKDVWEASRFACAFWMARAYALTGDERYPTAFWKLFDDWCVRNPPNMGPNWKCGQEISFRIFALCFAVHAFWNSPATNDDRLVALTKLMAVSGARIARNIDYAYSQKNNHGISEALGLYTIGLLFPELKGAKAWRDRGRRYLELEIERQIYDDGSFVQHSMNYHRVMLHDCLWAVRLAELNDEPLPADLTGRVARAGEFLFEMIDAESGNVPNYGPNDGALVLPLSGCDYVDFRPTVQTANYQSTGRRILEDGPWNEMLLWLNGSEALESPRTDAEASSRRFDAGGYYTIRRPDGWCMIRCHTYRDRPSHLDMLHMDLWHRGVNILGDSGTYKYYAPGEPAAERYFKSVSAHNSIQIDGSDPLELVSRFLWLPWPEARCHEHSSQRFSGEHYAYDRAPWRVIHRRSVVQSANGWVVEDDLLGSGAHTIALRWHLVDAPLQFDEPERRLTLTLPFGTVRVSIEGPSDLRLAIHRGSSDDSSYTGWESRYYGERVPRPTLEAIGRFELPVRLVTRIDLGAAADSKLSIA